MRKQSSNVRAIGRAVRGIDLGVLRAIESLLVRGESTAIAMPLLAVCGAPRSGHSLTTQVITQGTQVFFVDNLQYVFFRTPLIGYRLSKLFTRPYVSDFRSSRGYVRGMGGPQEGVLVWNYWCDMYEEERPPHPDPERVRELGRLLNRIYAQDRRPYCATWVGHTFYFDELSRLFPRYVIVRCRRDMLSTAVSIAKLTRNEQGEWAASWMALRPRECQDLELMAQLSPYERVAWQVYFINRRLDEQSASGQYAIFESEYRDLCVSPPAFIERLIAFAGQQGIELRQRPDTTLPERFDATGARRDENEHTKRIATALDRLVAEHGPVSVPIEER